ncbi:MAG: hypothetical protein ACPH9N_03150 [Alteromonas sp.]
MLFFGRVKRRRTKQCTRCGMHFNEDDIACPYCIGKNNHEIIRDIHMKQSEELEKNAKLGRRFALAAVIIAALMVLLWI